MAVDLPRLELPRRDSLAAEISRLLINYMFSERLPMGGKLPSERQLADTLGVGRSAVREALKSLSLLGLLEIRQGDGTYLRGPDSELLPQVIEWGLLLGERRTLDLVEARGILEVDVARLAAERRTSEDVEALRGFLDQMRNAKESDAFVDADVAFHTRLSQAAGNQILADVLRSIKALLRAWITRVVESEKDTGPSYRDHVPIFEAVRTSDPDGAVEAMQIHMAAATARLIGALDSARLADADRLKA